MDLQIATIPILEIKLLLAIQAHSDMELIQMDTTTAFISVTLKPGARIYCNPPCGVDLGLGAHCFPSWKPKAPLEETRPAAMQLPRTQSSSIPIQSFVFVAISSGDAFWMYSHPPDEMLLYAIYNIDMQYIY